MFHSFIIFDYVLGWVYETLQHNKNKLHTFVWCQGISINT